MFMRAFLLDTRIVKVCNVGMGKGKTMYQERRIHKHHAGFEMWQQDNTEGSELYESPFDIIAAAADNGCALIELGTPEAEALGVEDIRGRIYNQRGTIYAFAYGDDTKDIGYTTIVEVNA